MMKIPCHDCTVGDWGACHHLEYGQCMYKDFKLLNMERIYSKKELQSLNAFELWPLAEKMKVTNFEHLPQDDLIEAILEIQEELVTNNENQIKQK